MCIRDGIRLLRAGGVHLFQDYIPRFGFAANKPPPYLTMALGAGSVTPWEMVTAYAVFANGGYRILTHRSLLYTSDAADDRSRVHLGGRRII